MGFPPHYTAPLLQLNLKDYEFEHRRRSLLGNSWCVFVVVFILQCMGVSSADCDVPSTPSPSSFLLRDCSIDVPSDLLREFEAAATAVQDRFPVPLPRSLSLHNSLSRFLSFLALTLQKCERRNRTPRYLASSLDIMDLQSANNDWCPLALPLTCMLS